MPNIKDQLNFLSPSVPDALFRRLIREDDLSYLREDDQSIIGFEVDLERSQPLSGKTTIGIEKHTILAYRSDLHEAKKLILFPNLEKLFNEAFNLLGLMVHKKRYFDSSFNGTLIESGELRRVVAELTPPARKIDLPDSVTEEMVQAMLEAAQDFNTETRRTNLGVDEFSEEAADGSMLRFLMDKSQNSQSSTPISGLSDTSGFTTDFSDPGAFQDGPPAFDEPPTFDGPPAFDSPPAFDGPPIQVEAPVMVQPQHDSRAQQLLDANFTTITQVSNMATLLGVPNAVVNQIISKVLQMVKDDDVKRIEFARQLFAKMFDEGRI